VTGKANTYRRGAPAQIRHRIADLGGVPLIVGAMRAWPDSGGVQCNACLAIVSLVRAESEVCQVTEAALMDPAPRTHPFLSHEFLDTS
jgi:hypothetical protein